MTLEMTLAANDDLVRLRRETRQSVNTWRRTRTNPADAPRGQRCPGRTVQHGIEEHQDGGTGNSNRKGLRVWFIPGRVNASGRWERPVGLHTGL